MKVMTVVGTRPEIIKLSRVIPALDEHFEHVLVHTGQNYDPQLSDVFFEDMVRAPDEQLGSPHDSPGMLKIACILSDVDCMLDKHKPCAVLVLGDTNSALSVYAAKRRHIPVFHMEAGNRCFDQRVPEELNRKLVDHMADINMPYTEHARRNLLAEGLPTDRIIKTGSPMAEVIRHYNAHIQASQIHRQLGLELERYFVVSAHREENVDDPRRLEQMVSAINQLATRYPVVLSLHPRTAARLRNIGMFASNVRVHDPFGFFDYAALQSYAACVISDSGTLSEESALLDFPAVTTRQAHERPEGFEDGDLIMSELSGGQVLYAVEVAMAHGPSVGTAPEDYIDTDISKKVVRTILSYTGYVKRNVWRQY